MNPQDYLTIRQTGMQLVVRIMETCVSSEIIMKAAGELGLVENRTIVIDDPLENETLADFIVFDSTKGNKPIIDAFLDTDPELTDAEHDMLDAMNGAEFSMYEIVSVDAAAATLHLRDLLLDVPATLMDRGLSRSTGAGLLLGTRLIPIAEDLSMTSGACFIFRPSARNSVILELSKARLKRKHPTSRELFIAFWKLSKSLGIRTRSELAERL